MAELSVRELREEKGRKIYGNALVFEIICNFEKPSLNRKSNITKIKDSGEDHCSLFTGPLFSLQSPLSARDKK